MRHLRLIPLSFCLLLAACGGDELVLHFDTPVNAAEGGIDPALRESLERVLGEQQFVAEQVDFKLLGDSQSVRVSFAGEPLSTERRQALRDAFTARLEARKQWTGKLTLEIQPERLDEFFSSSSGGYLDDDLRQQVREKTQRLRRTFTSTVTFDEELGLVYQKGDKPMAFVESDEIFCQVTAQLSRPLPNLDLRLTMPNEGAALGEFFQTMGEYLPITIPHRLLFSGIEMQTSLDEQRVEYRLRSDPQAVGGQNYIDFDFERLGMLKHSAGAATDPERFESLQRECMNRVTKAGRPFTYFYGKTLDRLQAVEYHFQDES